MSCQPRSRLSVDSALALLTRVLVRSRCLVCGAPGMNPHRDLCAGCAGELPRLRHCCRRCAQPLAVSASRCGGCLRRTPRFDFAFSPFHYQAPIDALVRGLKYADCSANGRLLAQLFADEFMSAGGRRPDCIIPVPLSSERFRHRGFNQAIELGRVISKALSLPLLTNVVARLRDTPEQAGLALKARRRNVRGAFELTGRLPYSHVAVLDDVMTSGSTLNEVARVLRKGGARVVDVWAVARAGEVRD